MTPEKGPQLTVPPGFRFHPTDEELVYYYLRKKLSYEAIDLDVITEVDLNKLEPWDLKDKCRIGSGHQNEWYFFSHKDRKYPTGTRTNRATTAGFWKATGRDKSIHHHLSNMRIGMRKTLVFYTGRAPHGQKTDWIMHEYRLDHDINPDQLQAEDGWVVCRVFKKKTCHNRSATQEQEQDLEFDNNYQMKLQQTKSLYDDYYYYNNSSNCFDGHLPQLFSPESSSSSFTIPTPSMNMMISTSTTLNNNDNYSAAANINNYWPPRQSSRQDLRLNTDWSFLNKLLSANNNSSHHQEFDQLSASTKPATNNLVNSTIKFPFPLLASHSHPLDLIKFSN